uniref:Uncharacterized protein n=1 Tax=Lotharella oceanica TaxID=641309 RepID=A0A7S2U289_9EUKA|mmetsp:Transcript_6991/g.13799  ORF Transcript_6991/g.13799 Transcript_6991/m.13799 type:complete len:176 (+) Transcript_6991:226-753(+)|eukprot:CAMPEP_0170176212 /NCGR_PEP_ID=MMETSP0040_2-20121228/9150_1 /TAXON_ID=641309 /ORGANISM="Lotharella oceanica, Strain CCMP622" /LENGTH=175 /DNA_ID=CAMNT_0010418473 /DNA_START=130 /DNA_END=657 /DNA_ORIENTATION=+
MAATAPPVALENRVDDEKDQFEIKSYNVQCFCDVLCCTTKDLVLRNDELYYKYWCTPCNCGKEAHYPYGELSGVGEVKMCCCCPAVNPGFQDSPEGPTTFLIGCCGDQEMTTEIVEELKQRTRARGDIGQMKKTEELRENMTVLLAKVSRLEANVAAIMKHLKVPAPTESEMKMQ